MKVGEKEVMIIGRPSSKLGVTGLKSESEIRKTVSLELLVGFLDQDFNQIQVNSNLIIVI